MPIRTVFLQGEYMMFKGRAQLLD